MAPQLFDVWMSKVQIQPANYEELELIVLGMLYWAIFIKLLISLKFWVWELEIHILQAMEMKDGVETDAPFWVCKTSLEISHLTKLLDNKE